MLEYRDMKVLGFKVSENSGLKLGSIQWRLWFLRLIHLFGRLRLMIEGFPYLGRGSSNW